MKSSFFLLFPLILMSGTGVADDVADINNLAADIEVQHALTISSVKTIRMESLLEEAWLSGFRSGYRKEFLRQKILLEGIADSYDRVYQFSDLLIDGDVLPPVVSVIEGVHIQSVSGVSSSEILRHYEIVLPAKIVSQDVDWRSWFSGISIKKSLSVGYVSPISPETAEEIKAFNVRHLVGSDEGSRVASHVFDLASIRLRRDFKGMLVATRLMEEGMLSRPIKTQKMNEITLNDDRSEMALFKKESRIIVPSQLIGDSQKWNPIVVFEK